MAPSSGVFKLDGVSKHYGATVALDGVTLEAGENEYISLLGPSGSGKTALLRVIAGFDAPDAGRVYLNGSDITEMPAHERGIGFVFQNFALFPHLTVMSNVTFGLINSETALSETDAKARSQDMINMVGLAGFEDRGVDQISGGQRQRVALARTLVMEPKLVLLDEPLGALDANLRSRMRNELRAIREKLGVTFLHVTGSETEALAMGDRVVILNNGRIIQTGAPNDVYSAPASPEVAHFLNRFNLFEGTMTDGIFSGPFGSIAVKKTCLANSDVYGVRFDRIQVSALSAPPSGPKLKASFVTNEYVGSAVMSFFEIEGGKHVEVEHHLSLGHPDIYNPRQDYFLTWDPDKAIVFGRGVL
tara:strand:+ start:13693 stop:14772 length:1080 start_codon:yes stop_codon:yes gene_type:complete